MADLKLYRNTRTGLVAEYPPSAAEVFPDEYVEVPDGTKPLAYVPISPDAIDALHAEALAADAAPAAVDPTVTTTTPEGGTA